MEETLAGRVLKKEPTVFLDTIKMMPAHPHVPFFPKFGICPEIFSNMLILKLPYLKIQNLKIKQKFSRTVLIY